MSDTLPTDSLLLSIEDVCRRLSIGRTTLHAMTRAGKFPLAPIRLGRAVRYSAQELTQWVTAGCPAADRWRMLQQANAARRAG